MLHCHASILSKNPVIHWCSCRENQDNISRIACLFHRAMLPSCEVTNSPIPVVPLVEPSANPNGVLPGDQDQVLESEIGSNESTGATMQAAAAAAALFSSKYCPLTCAASIHGKMCLSSVARSWITHDIRVCICMFMHEDHLWQTEHDCCMKLTVVQH